MTATDREREELLDDMRNWPNIGIGRLGELLNEAQKEIATLMRENEALRTEVEQLKKTQIKFRKKKPMPFVIRDEP